jgi:hypothetical protein
MKRTAFAIALAGWMMSSVVFAGGGGHEDESAADYIMHHVADAEKYEFEIPWPGVEQHNPVLHLDKIFSFLQVK